MKSNVYFSLSVTQWFYSSNLTTFRLSNGDIANPSSNFDRTYKEYYEK